MFENPLYNICYKIILEHKDRALKLAPLAQSSSFLSCQDSGNQPPENQTQRRHSSSSTSITSCSSNSGSEQDLGQIFINTNYADIKSISDYDDRLSENKKHFLNLPQIEIQAHSQVFTKKFVYHKSALFHIISFK